jgi:hypothetical protein
MRTQIHNGAASPPHRIKRKLATFFSCSANRIPLSCITAVGQTAKHSAWWNYIGRVWVAVLCSRQTETHIAHRLEQDHIKKVFRKNNGTNIENFFTLLPP